MAVTVVMYFLSGRTGFDSDMRNINFMTESQRRDLEMLQGGLEQSGCHQIYAIAEGDDPETALERNDNLLARLDSLKGLVAFVKGAGNFIPSEKTQSERLARWNDFWGGGRAERLVKELSDESRRQGFAESAFSPFTDILTKEYSVSSTDDYP